MLRFESMCSELNSIKGTNEKIAKLKTYEDIKYLIKIIWEPNTTTGVTKKGLLDFKTKKGLVKDTDLSLVELLEKLIKRELTGDDARATIWGFIEKHKHEETLLGIFEKNPRIRMSETLIEKAFPGIFNIFKVTLAMEYTQETFDTNIAKYKKAFMSRKLDGMRLITIIKKDITFYSRVGNVVTSLDVLRKDMETLIRDQLHDEELTEGIVFDGEIVSYDGAKEDFKKTISEVRQIDKQMANPHYFIFDVLSLSEFQGEKESDLLDKRIEKLRDILNPETKHCHLLEQIPWSPTAQKTLIDKARQNSWEGIMIRFNTMYEPKRTKNLLKYKFIKDGEYQVKKVVTVDMPFPNAQGGETIKKAVKSVIIEHKNCEVNVGSGFSADERIKYAKNPELLQDQTILVNYQEEFMDKNGYSLRCPIFKALLGTRNF